jgi:hypothetical protein
VLKTCPCLRVAIGQLPPLSGASRQNADDGGRRSPGTIPAYGIRWTKAALARAERASPLGVAPAGKLNAVKRRIVLPLRRHGSETPTGDLLAYVAPKVQVKGASPSDGMADMEDSKSSARKGVWVQIPPRVRPPGGPSLKARRCRPSSRTDGLHPAAAQPAVGGPSQSVLPDQEEASTPRLALCPLPASGVLGTGCVAAHGKASDTDRRIHESRVAADARRSDRPEGT